MIDFNPRKKRWYESYFGTAITLKKGTLTRNDIKRMQNHLASKGVPRREARFTVSFIKDVRHHPGKAGFSFKVENEELKGWWHVKKELDKTWLISFDGECFMESPFLNKPHVRKPPRTKSNRVQGR